MNLDQLEGTVSVIIPVYNAGLYVKKAVASAATLPEVLEVILVEDGSKDDSLEICKQLVVEHQKVVLIQHKGGINRGPGLTRNLGVKQAQGQFVAFLDADDYFLPNRFTYLSNHPLKNDIDGCYEVIGVTYESNSSKEKHLDRMKNTKRNILSPKIPLDHTGIESLNVKPKDLFYHLLRTDLGWIHLNGLTIRKTSLENFDLFNQSFLGQDSEFIARLSDQKRLISSNSLEPVAIRRVHHGNRITNEKFLKIPKQTSSRQYWVQYCIQNNKFGKELWYLLLRLSDAKNYPTKILKLLFNTASILISMLMEKTKILVKTKNDPT